MSGGKTYHNKLDRGNSAFMKLLLSQRREQHALGSGAVDVLKDEEEIQRKKLQDEFQQTNSLETKVDDDTLNLTLSGDGVDTFQQEENNEKEGFLSTLFNREEIDPKEQEKFKNEFQIYAEHKIELINEGIDLDFNDDRKPLSKEEKKNAFIAKRDLFQKRMNKPRRNFWGTKRYYRLLNKWFPDYELVISNKVLTVKNTIHETITTINANISNIIETLKEAIDVADSDIGKALELLSTAQEYIDDVSQSKENTINILNEFGKSKTQDYEVKYDAVLNKYQELVFNLQTTIQAIGQDKTKFETTITQLAQQQTSLIAFNLKVENTSGVIELVELQNTEFIELINSTEKIIADAKNIERITVGVDETSVLAEFETNEQTINTFKTEVENIKQQEIERRKKEEERKRKEEELRKKAEVERLKKEQELKKNEEKDKDETPSIFIKEDSQSIVSPQISKQSSKTILEGRGAEDYTKTKWDPSTSFKDSKNKIDESNFSKSEKEFFIQYKNTCDSYLKEWYSGKNVTQKLTGDMFVNAAKRIFIKYKHLSYVVPAELALIQGRLESGLGTKGASSYTNPMNVGETDKGAKSWVKKMTSPVEGIFFYMDLMAHDYLSAKTADQLLEKQGETFVNEDGSRYASAPRYEMELKAMMGQVGLVRDNKRTMVNVGKNYEKNDNSESAIFVREMLTKLGYNQSNLGDAIEAFQKKEMYPPLTSAQKKSVSNMNSGDKKSFDIKESKGIDGSASPKANTIGLLYYMTYMGNTVASFSTTKDDQISPLQSNKSKIEDFYKQYKKGDIDMIALGKNLLPYSKYYATEVIDIIDKLGWSEQDNLAYVLANKATEIELKHFDPKLLKKMQELLDPANNWTSIAEKKVQWERVKLALGEEKVEKAKLDTKKDTKNNQSKTIAVDFKITGSVGAEGDNIVEDVKKIQDLLINFNYLEENDSEVTLVLQSIKAKPGTKLKDSQLNHTIAAIKQFQKYGATTGKTLVNQDGRVDKSGGTITSMRELNRVYVNYKNQKFEDDIPNVLKETQWVSQFRYGYNFRDGEDKLEEKYANFITKETGLADPADLTKASKAQREAVENEYSGKGTWFDQETTLSKHGIKMSQKARKYKPNYVCCWDAANTMLGFTGASEKGANYKIQTFVADVVKGKVKNGGYTNQMPIGIKYIDGQLKAGKAVFIGVEKGKAKSHNEGVTDHYILIVGKHKNNENKYYYNYFDPGTGDKTKGCDLTKNRLLIADDKSGVENSAYKLSQIRTNNE